MPLTPDRITVDPSGRSTAVTITNSFGDDAVCYDSLDGESVVTFPDTITTATTYYVTDDGDYTVSGLVGTVEVGPSAPVAARYGVPATVKMPVNVDALIGVGVGNSAAATTPGSVVKKVEVFDASGVSLGFMALYDAIT